MENSSALSIAGDILVLILPLPIVWNLQLNLRTKIKVTFLFLLGLLVTIIAILRCVSLVRQDFQSPEFAITSQDSLAYAVLETNIAIICSCLPMLQNIVTAWKERSGHVSIAAGSSDKSFELRSNSVMGSDAPTQSGVLRAQYIHDGI
ncbi:hypothetical protein F4677DRAFT_134466 [Hypoxylon crocopeplum]|nr:hypothetical protein F4677DRAFT_134466 [Hypoxylon crocopeplum]